MSIERCVDLICEAINLAGNRPTDVGLYGGDLYSLDIIKLFNNEQSGYISYEALFDDYAVFCWAPTQ